MKVVWTMNLINYKYKDILSSGSEEERAHMKKKMETLRSKLKEENQRAQNRVQLTPEEIKEIASDSKNFTPSQWEFLQKAKENLAKEKSEKEMRIQMQKRERQKQLREKGKRRSSSRKSGWMKS